MAAPPRPCFKSINHLFLPKCLMCTNCCYRFFGLFFPPSLSLHILPSFLPPPYAFIPALVEPAVKRMKTGLVAYTGDSSDEEEDHCSSKASGPGNPGGAPLPPSSGWMQGYRCPPPQSSRSKTQPQSQSIPFWMAR